MLPNDIRFAETKPLNEGRTSFLVCNLLLCSRRGFSRFCRLELARPSALRYRYVAPFTAPLSVSRSFEIREI